MWLRQLGAMSFISYLFVELRDLGWVLTLVEFILWLSTKTLAEFKDFVWFWEFWLKTGWVQWLVQGLWFSLDILVVFRGFGRAQRLSEFRDIDWVQSLWLSSETLVKFWDFGWVCFFFFFWGFSYFHERFINKKIAQLEANQVKQDTTKMKFTRYKIHVDCR